VFLINHTGAAVVVEAGGTDLLTDADAARVTVTAGGVAVIRQHR